MKKKILLVDDSATQLSTMKAKLEDSGFIVETAIDGAEGYQKVFSTAPDLVLSDILMPNLNGYQFSRLLKNNPLTRKIPIILLTVLDKNIDKFWGQKARADKFLSKSTEYEKLEKTINEFMAKAPISEEYKQVLLSHTMSKEAINNQINSLLDELLMNSTFLNEFRDLTEFLMHEKVLIEKTFSLLSSFVDYNVAGLFFNKHDKHEKNILNLDLSKKHISNFVIEKIKRDFFSEMPDMKDFNIRDFSHDIVRESVESEGKIVSTDDFKAKHIIPMISEGKLLGGICFYYTEDVNYQEFKFYNTMVKEILLLFKMRYLYSETEYLSVTDGLTGLYNRRHFDFNIQREFSRARRYPCDLSIAIIDIDHFKQINDTYGHLFGDFVLQELSGLISKSFRKTDMIYRYGGEELVIILTETSMDNALIPITRLKETVANHVFKANGIETNVTISIGVSVNYHTLETEKDLVESADACLYKAKQNGRNRIETYLINEESEQPI